MFEEKRENSVLEARLIMEDNKEDITNWCQEGQSLRMVKIPEIVGDRNIGDYVVKFDFGFVIMAKDVFDLFYKESQ